MYLTAFLELDSCRAVGFGCVGPIPWTAIDAWAKRYGFEGDDFEVLLHHVRELDRERLAYDEETRSSKDGQS